MSPVTAICLTHGACNREAAIFWNEPTSDGFSNMRSKIDVELAAVAEEVAENALKFCKEDITRLIAPYPAHRRVDSILEKVGEDYFHDEVHALCDGSDEPAHSLRVSQMLKNGAS